MIKRLQKEMIEKSKVIKNTFLIALIILIVGVFIMPNVLAVSIGSGVTPVISTEKFAPKVWMCNDRVVYDDNTSPGRTSSGGQNLIERMNNYAFEGEQIKWTVLVMDKNGITNVKDVFATMGDTQGTGNDIQVNCKRISNSNSTIDPSCNARIQQLKITTFDSEIMAYYECRFTVETPESMYGEYWITVEAEDSEGLSNVMSENEYWFMNPVIALSIEGDISFDNVRPGTSSYSRTLIVGNDADQGSGVMLDMFISGTDFYDSSSKGALCPNTNQLSLTRFRYYATKGAYSTAQDLGVGRGSRVKDAKGYIGIPYGKSFNSPNSFYDGYEILQAAKSGSYYTANMLSPGSEFSITFRLDMPEPCTGDFDTGSIYFWGEAV